MERERERARPAHSIERGSPRGYNKEGGTATYRRDYGTSSHMGIWEYGKTAVDLIEIFMFDVNTKGARKSRREVVRKGGEEGEKKKGEGRGSFGG